MALYYRCDCCMRVSRVNKQENFCWNKRGCRIAGRSFKDSLNIVVCIEGRSYEKSFCKLQSKAVHGVDGHTNSAVITCEAKFLEYNLIAIALEDWQRVWRLCQNESCFSRITV